MSSGGPTGKSAETVGPNAVRTAARSRARDPDGRGPPIGPSEPPQSGQNHRPLIGARSTFAWTPAMSSTR